MRQNGFSLMELMIVVTIIGILATIAVPSYQQYVYRANRAVAKTAIMKIYAQQESYYNDRKAYATALTALPDYGAATVYLKRDGTTQATQGTSTIYRLTLTAYSSSNIAACSLSGAATGTQYAILATPVNAQARDGKCQLLCAGSAGDKGATGTQSGTCWTR